MSPRTTIREVAARAGVSTATVSYVLNGTGSVSAETAERVRTCVAELGYRANGLAVAHRTGRSQTIGLAIADLTNPFFPEFAKGVHERAAAQGFGVILADSRGCADEEFSALDRLADRVPEGVIWVPVGPAPTSFDFPFPMVSFDLELPGIDSVNAAVHRGGELQAELVAEYGHTCIGVISGPDWSETGRLRRDGLLNALGPDVEVAWEISLDYSVHTPAEARSEILSRREVTCVVTANDVQAIGLLQIYRDAGWSVPDDVSVIGFDDIDLASRISPALTTISLPTEELGAAAFDMLHRRICEPDRPVERVRLPVSATVRDSLKRRQSIVSIDAPGAGLTGHSSAERPVRSA